MLSQDQVRHLAKLARLGLTEEEIQKFSLQVGSILEYVEKLNEINTDNVEPTTQVSGLKNIMRDDEVQPFSDRKQLLDCSELPQVFDQVKVKPVITS